MSTDRPVTSNNGDFFKSSYSNDGPSCVEVKFLGDCVLIRDSKQNSDYADAPDTQPTIAIPTACWTAFLDLALSSRPGTVGTAEVSVNADGSAELAAADTASRIVTLRYTADEWEAFGKGVADGEFRRP
ncbi:MULTISPECIES: DUF397 domain-containing protein [Nocardia]|uniref:DUF397 domain-containing protein n=2 Tax=Nocardia TaxID=1817 RepID=A0A846XFX6_9NOCA|nr:MULTISPECIES: DUF397 domain-containing protein [Nocardia]MBF6456033.1 DUF397 domain-containing protein [Nocardia cyriacigeorgica]MBF6553226.1 DUF397 domain-containing protein [Nocardia cyriacigeorgica]NKY34862.1 DUF397 domain-containing protein [Nocardia speluncae]TLF77691.1 DUF397 domain-containing protein [Nocardia cyriacigeorgica]